MIMILQYASWYENIFARVCARVFFFGCVWINFNPTHTLYVKYYYTKISSLVNISRSRYRARAVVEKWNLI